MLRVKSGKREVIWDFTDFLGSPGQNFHPLSLVSLLCGLENAVFSLAFQTSFEECRMSERGCN